MFSIHSFFSISFFRSQELRCSPKATHHNSIKLYDENYAYSLYLSKLQEYLYIIIYIDIDKL